MSLTFVFVVWVLGFGMFSIAIREIIARKVASWNLPIIVKYYVILTPIILLEEALTIEGPYFWGIFPMVITFYIFFFFIFTFPALDACLFFSHFYCLWQFRVDQ